MADEQANTPSAEAPASDVAAAEQHSDEQSEGSSTSWWSRLFNRRSPEQEAESDSGDAKHADDGRSSTALSLTPEELERRIQSETDRREAKRVQEAKIAQRRELRDKDPWAYAEQERKDEEVRNSSGQLNGLVVGIAQNYDRASIDPVVEALPQSERDRILKLEGAGTGLDGRKLLVTESLRALEKHWKAEGAKEAESKLRRNQTFRKQIWSEFRGETREPELLPGSASSAADETVSALLRSHYNLRQ